MNHLNTNIVFAGIILIIQALLMQACSNDVGGNEDTTPSVVTLNAITDANDSDGEIIGKATILWTTDEPNPSTVDIFLSSDSGTTFDTTIALNAPDIGEYVWDTNSVADCRACRLRIIATDIARNVGGPAESVDDFIINNVPQVLGSAFYTDLNNDGPGNGDSILVPFDKDVELLTAIASDIFFIPVLGDSIGPFATVAKGGRQNELVITFNDLANSYFHLHLHEVFDQKKLNLTAPSGLNLRDNLAQGILFALDTGRTAAPAENGIDIAPAFSDSGQALTGGGIVGGGGGTTSNALGDVDGDGDLDLVTNIFVLLNDGGGAFTDSGQAPGDLGVLSIALGDVDDDGDLDLVTGNTADNRVWLNDGSGVFADSGQALGNGNTQSVALGDVDVDGDLDLVTGNGNLLGEPNRIWLNNGSGAFTDSGQALGNGNTQSVALGDVDGDGDFDLVTGNIGENRVWLNDGSGVLTDSGQALGNGNTQSVALGDVDGDGDLDLVTGNVLGEPNLVWLNNGSGVFTDAGQVLGNDSTESVELGDVDGDGDFDLVTGNIGVNRVWLNNGSGAFNDSGQALGNIGTLDIALGDVDDDGDLDLVSGNSGFDRVWLNSYRSLQTDVFLDSSQALGISETSSIVLGDVDGDGDLDHVTGNGVGLGGNEPNRVWLNDGSGAFIDSGQALGNGNTRSIALGDVDGDGDFDLVTGNIGENRVWLNNGSGVFTDAGQVLGSGNTQSVALGDVDGDGDLDLVTGNSDDNRVWLNNGSGVFTDSGQVLGNIGTLSIALGDVDGDGDLDLVTGNEIGEPNRVWLNNGSGVFADSGQALGNVNTQSVELGDVDGDGDLDLVTGNGREVGNFGLGEDNHLWLNNGSGVFTDTGQVLGNGNTKSVALRDVDGDNDLDLIIANGLGVNVANRVWLNNITNRQDQKGVFTEVGKGLGDGDSQSIAFGDVDSDGDLDFVTGNFGNNRVWLNDY
jgi:hypothetical protein